MHIILTNMIYIYSNQILYIPTKLGIKPNQYKGIYPPESFKRESKYGLTVLITTDEGLLSYLDQIMSQMESWFIDGDIQRLVVVVGGVDSGETLERWQFNVSVDEKVDGKGFRGNENENIQNIGNIIDAKTKKERGGKSIREIHSEIQAIIRQITASVSRVE